MGSTDYLEQYFATNIVFEPLVGELVPLAASSCRSAAAQNDFMTPSVVSAAEADYERNLANTVDLFHLLAKDEQLRRRQPRAVPELARASMRRLPTSAASTLQPLWSKPRVEAGLVQGRAGEVATNASGRSAANLDSSGNRATSADLTHEIATIQETAYRVPIHANIFKSMKDIEFEDTISHQCGVTMNDCVEARAIAELMARSTASPSPIMPALIRIDGDGKLDLQDGRDLRSISAAR